MASDCCMCSLSISQIRHGCFSEISGMLIIIRNKLISYHLHLTVRMKYSETHSHQPERPLFCVACMQMLVIPCYNSAFMYLHSITCSCFTWSLKRSKALCKLVTLSPASKQLNTQVLLTELVCWHIHYLKIHFEGIQDISTLISS